MDGQGKRGSGRNYRRWLKIKRKAMIFSNILAFFVAFNIISGSVFGGFITQQTINEEIEYNIGGTNIVKEVKVRYNNYVNRMPQALNYSSNTAAVELASNGGHEDSQWEDGEIHDVEQLKTWYREGVLEKYLDRSKVGAGCDINSSSAVLSVDHPVYEVGYQGGGLECSDSHTMVSKPIETITVENPDNRYMDIAGHAPTLARAVDDKVEDTDIDWTGSETREGVCTSDSDDLLDDVEEAAEEKAEEGIHGIAGNAIDEAADEGEATNIKVDIAELENRTEIDSEVEQCNEENCDASCDSDDEEAYRAEATAEVTGVVFDFEISDDSDSSGIPTRNAEEEEIVFELNYLNDEMP